jgi:hypothetical protein
MAGMQKIIWLIALIPAIVYTWVWAFWTGIAFLQPPYPHNIKPMAWVLIIGQTYVGILLLIVFVKEVKTLLMRKFGPRESSI